MPPKAPKAPAANAPKEEHKKHAAEFLAIEDFKKPRNPNYKDTSDEAKP